MGVRGVLVITGEGLLVGMVEGDRSCNRSSLLGMSVLVFLRDAFRVLVRGRALTTDMGACAALVCVGWVARSLAHS